MATVYSSEVAVGPYNRIRLRVEYSGTAASCFIEFRRVSSWTDTWADYQATISLNGVTQSAPYSYSGTVSTTWIAIASASGFSIPRSGGTLSWSFSNPSGGVLGCSGTVDIASTQPSGLSLSNIVAGRDSITANVSVSDWGIGGSTATSYLELSVCTGQSVAQRKWAVNSGRTSPATITVDNNATSSAGSPFTITPNTTYYLTMWASNGASSIGNTAFTQVTTLPAPSAKLYGSYNDQTKEVKKLYGSLNGQTKLIKKLYGSHNGVTKLVYEA